jgi:hypothetical protein
MFLIGGLSPRHTIPVVEVPCTHPSMLTKFPGQAGSRSSNESVPCADVYRGFARLARDAFALRNESVSASSAWMMYRAIMHSCHCVLGLPSHNSLQKAHALPSILTTSRSIWQPRVTLLMMQFIADALMGTVRSSCTTINIDQFPVNLAASSNIVTNTGHLRRCLSGTGRSSRDAFASPRRRPLHHLHRRHNEFPTQSCYRALGLLPRHTTCWGALHYIQAGKM